MTVLILHETVTGHDAVGNDIELMFNILSEKYTVYVYAHTQKNRNVEYAAPEMVEDIIKNPDNVVLYHHSAHWQEGYEILKRAKCRIIFRYHNITPPNFFKYISDPHYKACLRGREQTKQLIREFPDSFWISDSKFNARDLRAADEKYLKVVPPFNKLETWGKICPDEEVSQKLQNFDGINLLFVGRVVPNKGHLLLLDVLYQYCKNYDRNIKLRIIGKSEAVMNPYFALIESKIKEYDLREQIEFIGEVTDETLAAYYKNSDALVCCSAHEGFCVPVVEAQYFGLPVIALRYCAVPETVGEEQLLLEYDPLAFAAAIHSVCTNDSYSKWLADRGRKNFETRFSYSVIEKKFLDAFDEIIAGKAEKESGTDTETETDTELGTDTEKAKKLKVAFVSPWFSEKIQGGAEMLLRTVTRYLKDAGVDVEILTTQVRNFQSDWSKNYYPEGTEYIWNIPVTRFPVRKRDTRRFDEINRKLMKGEHISAEEENDYLREMVNSPELYTYIRENRDYYDSFLFIPYMFGTTYYGVRECYDKAVMIPCYHDEAYAYMNRFREEYSRVAGCLYNAAPEGDLAERLFDLSNTKKLVMGIIVMGNGMYSEISGDAERFRKKYHIDEPFLLYAGRKDAGKGVDELIDYFCEYRENNKSALKLVLIGGGKIDIPEKYREKYCNDIIDLGFVDIQDKYDACSAATALCQLSKHESFSLVIMESWLCGRPVIVSRGCEVTRDFAERFNGGFAVDDYREFENSVNTYLNDTKLASQMGENGRNKVKENFTWDVIVNKHIQFFTELKEEKRPVTVDVEKYIETFKLQ